MKDKTIRGLKRRSKEIEKWRINYLRIDFDQLKKLGDDYVKIWIAPWQNLRYLDGNRATPKKEVKDQILNALIDIYESWEYQLKLNGEPYYLKIWLFDPRFSSSQVVCAIGERIKYYESLFYSDMKKKEFPTDKFLKLECLSQFDFQVYLDEEILDDNDFPERKFYQSDSDYAYDQRYLTKLKNGKARIEEIISDGEKYNAYFVKKGNVWVGEKRQTDELVS